MVVGDHGICVSKKSLRRKICSDEILYDHQQEEVKVQREKSLMSNHDQDSLHLPNNVDVESSPISAHPEHFSPNPNEKTTKCTPISIPTLDSPTTRAKLRKQGATSNENRFENEDHLINEHPREATFPKGTRSPIKMKTIAFDKQSRVDLVFNEYRQSISEESIGLTFFLGPLVREVVPVNLENWKELPIRLKIVL